MKRYLLLLILASVLVFFEDCKKSNQGFTIGQYPLSVGDKWTYLLTDYNYGINDTIMVVVMAKEVYSGDSSSYYTKTFIHGQAVDSFAINAKNNIINYTYTNSPYGVFSNLHLSFPFNTCSQWKGEDSTDQIQVLGTGGADSISFFGITYHNLYSVRRTESAPSLVVQDIMVLPNVGVVYETLTQRSPSMPPINQSLYLLSYELH